ncbi:glycosyltransferase family 4 protein [Sporosarcina aquimarina]|uniref:glycosyltransferase family 4 protein n=1 Tax=Sporosarcina aquimarina TaxID=114975 RepID=UPI0020409D25|nr:glycosyltransferase family 4 protein [Sporosarcina aquimarina]MCM3756319.1 glycosyltransferase family 4 protein [Sporosarcina aquimarina]
MKKILIVSTVSRQFYLFEQGNIEVLKSLGFEVHAAANFSDANERLDSLGIIRHPFDINRSPFSLKNIKAYKQLKEVMKFGHFDAIHCHSPMGGVIARLVAKSLGVTPVIYTAHGFHFYKGAPFINWAVYYTVEKFMARCTDHLITINQEDFQKANEFKAGKVHYVPGIGVDTSKFNVTVYSREEKRTELEIDKDTVVLLSIGEMIKRKNHETALRALEKLKDESFVYLICGRGELDSYLKDLTVSLGIQEKVKFLGYRNDIKEICIASDIFIFPSYQEGLPVSVMEAMSAGLPIVASEIRGNTDLIENGVGGYLLHPEDIGGFAETIQKVVKDKELRKSMGAKNKDEVKKYDISIVREKMRDIYRGL